MKNILLDIALLCMFALWLGSIFWIIAVGFASGMWVASSVSIVLIAAIGGLVAFMQRMT